MPDVCYPQIQDVTLTCGGKIWHLQGHLNLWDSAFVHSKVIFICVFAQTLPEENSSSEKLIKARILGVILLFLRYNSHTCLSLICHP